MEKQTYETPKMEIVGFETEDVIRTSGFKPGSGPGDFNILDIK